MITVKGGGGVLNNPPIVSDLQVVGEPTQTSISISYKVTDAELQITRHYLTVSGVYDKKEITKEVGYEMPDNLFTYTITGLTKATEYTIQIMCDDGHGQGNSNPLQVSTKDSILYSFTINENDSNPATRVSYGDEAVGISPATSNGLGGWEDKWPFNKIRVVGFQEGKVVNEINKADRTKYTDGSTVPVDGSVDVMTEFPTLYWRKSAPDGNIKFEISDYPLVGGDCYAHRVGEVVRPTIYVGSYLGGAKNGKLYSISNVTPTNNLSVEEQRELILIRGNGYVPYNFNIFTMLQVLVLLVYKNTNLQKALGVGYSGRTNTGGTDTKGWIYGTSSSSSQICFLGIEDIWGNLGVYVDGLFVGQGSNSGEIKICVDNIYDPINYTVVGTTELNGESGFIKKIHTGEKTGFFPELLSGSNSTYYTDERSVYRGYYASASGYSTNPSYLNDFGPFYLHVTKSYTSSSSYTGARLCYIGEVS